MVQGLHKIIQRFILPKFPWIDDYNIIVTDQSGFKFVLVTYYPKVEKKDFFDEEGFFVHKGFREAEDLTDTVFKMMGFDSNTIFEGVRFEAKEDKL